MVSMSVSPAVWNSEAAISSMLRLMTPATPSAMQTSIRAQRSRVRRSSWSAGRIRRFVNAECRYTTWGITVAPMIPTARSTLPGPSKRGIRPAIAEGTDAPTSVRS